MKMKINQNLLNELKRKLIMSHDEEIEEYYGTQIIVYKNIDKYLDELDSIYDKISLAQWANNYEKTNQLISHVTMTEEERRKYAELLSNNADLNETIDIRLLSAKYDFLGDMLDVITTNGDVQEQILSLTDEKLELFKMLYFRLGELIEYKVPQLTAILNRMGTITPYTYWQNRFYRYNDLEESISNRIKSGRSLSNDELDSLLYLYTTNLVWDISSLDELSSFVKKDGIFYQTIDSMIAEQEKLETKNIDVIKNALLLKTFGIDLISAKSICGRYDLNSIDLNQDNLDLFEMYQTMVKIINEKDSEILLNAYKEFSRNMNPKPNFARAAVFENALRKEFALKLNSVVYKCNGNYEVVSNVPIYNAGTNFKMIVTAIGAYQSDFDSKEDYKEYWNRPSISSHGNCCSLIGNNNLSMVPPKNVIFGFSTMNENMLLLSSSKDINSTPTSKRFNIVQEEYNGSNRLIDGREIIAIGRIGLGIEFTNPDILLDNTRGDYNELVYERRDLSSNPTYYKKNPDYIVFIEEYEDINVYFEEYKNDPEKIAFLEEQKRIQEFQFQESLKAAQNFEIPVVYINREKCAKNSVSYINGLLEQFESTKDASLISDVICEFENNRVGNHDRHSIIRDKYFSVEAMDSILSRIEDAISKVEDIDEKTKLLNKYYNSVLNEEKKTKACSIYRKNGQTSGINFGIVLERINEMASGDLVVESESEINLPTRR